jgi:hypothetical protein
MDRVKHNREEGEMGAIEAQDLISVSSTCEGQ